ncbi:MAG: hypothetical protein RXR51_08880 [Nitrososphaeria archaeon]
MNYDQNKNIIEYKEWNSENLDETIKAINYSINVIINALREQGFSDRYVRPLIYSDLNLNYDFIDFTVSAGTNALLPSTFEIPRGKVFAFYGFMDLTAGTKVLTYLQLELDMKRSGKIISKTMIPSSPIPIYGAWTDSENTVYFTPVIVKPPYNSMQIYLTSTSSCKVSFQLIGLVGTPYSL